MDYRFAFATWRDFGDEKYFVVVDNQCLINTSLREVGGALTLIEGFAIPTEGRGNDDPETMQHLERDFRGMIKPLIIKKQFRGWLVNDIAATDAATAAPAVFSHTLN